MNIEQKFAIAMSEQLFQMRAENIFSFDIEIPIEYINKIIDDPIHIKLMKERIRVRVLEVVTNHPNLYPKDVNGDYMYSSEVYDYSYELDTYVEDLYEKECQARLIRTYKVVVDVKEIVTDPETGESNVNDTDYHETLSEFESLEDATETQKSIMNSFNL